MSAPFLVEVVGGAVVRDGRVLASRRTAPPRLAGMWEFAGGKVEAGETDEQALVRELREELRCEVEVGQRVGPDLPIADGVVMRVYLATLLSGEPALVDHDMHRWLEVDELDDVPWIPADAPVIDALRQVLGGAGQLPA